jgi:hypothetical protein
MKRFSFLLGIGFLTFVVGVVSAWSFHRIFAPFSVDEEVSATLRWDVQQTVLPIITKQRLSGRLEIVSSRFSKIEGRPYAEFQLTNGNVEPVYYWGYGKNDTCGIKLKRGRRVKEIRLLCTCGTGLEERSLLPGESTTFQVDLWLIQKLIPDHQLNTLPTKEFKVGFDFLMGQARQSQTVWSGDIKVGDDFDRQTLSNDER